MPKFCGGFGTFMQTDPSSVTPTEMEM